MLWPDSSWNPVVGSSGVPAPASVPGHIVSGQLLVTVNMQENDLERRKEKMSSRNSFLVFVVMVIILVSGVVFEGFCSIFFDELDQ